MFQEQNDYEAKLSYSSEPADSKSPSSQKVQVKMDLITSSAATSEPISRPPGRRSTGLRDSRRSTKLRASAKARDHRWAGHGVKRQIGEQIDLCRAWYFTTAKTL